jgi:6-phosphogluconolactonase (cycloisomerase 2 family)
MSTTWNKEFLHVSDHVTVMCSTGAGPAHLLVDLEHSLVITANYGGGSLSVFNINRHNKLSL